jgi:hypothetical protein
MTHAPGGPGARRLPLPQESFSGDVNSALGLGRISWEETVFLGPGGLIPEGPGGEYLGATRT